MAAGQNPGAPPPSGGRGGRGSGGGGGRGGRRRGDNRARQIRISQAVYSLQNALIDKGFTADQAFRFARMALTQKGVEIGRNGNVHYKGALYNAAQFAANPLIAYVTGAKAKAANLATLKADPNYQAAVANLGLARDQQLAGLTAQQQQALLDFGDPRFGGGAAAGANPFSTSHLLQQAYDQQRQAAGENANVTGTGFGGGAQAAALGQQHAFAGQQANATSALQNLLNSIGMQQGQLGQQYDLGVKNALLQTQQNLAQAGTLSAKAPKFQVGTFNLFRAPRSSVRQGAGAVRIHGQGPYSNPGGAGFRRWGNYRNPGNAPFTRWRWG